MVRKTFVALAGVGMIAIVAALWLRVRQLEQSVDSLTRQLQSRPNVATVPVHVPVPSDEGKKQRIFRLIDSEYSEPEKGPFHPDVDRAMMIDAIQNQIPVQGVDPVTEPPAQIEILAPDALLVPDTNSLPVSVEPFHKAD